MAMTDRLCSVVSYEVSGICTRQEGHKGPHRSGEGPFDEPLDTRILTGLTLKIDPECPPERVYFTGLTPDELTITIFGRTAMSHDLGLSLRQMAHIHRANSPADDTEESNGNHAD